MGKLSNKIKHLGEFRVGLSQSKNKKRTGQLQIDPGNCTGAAIRAQRSYTMQSWQL